MNLNNVMNIFEKFIIMKFEKKNIGFVHKNTHKIFTYSTQWLCSILYLEFDMGIHYLIFMGKP